MHKGRFTDEEMEHLSSLDAVRRVEPLRITYSREFKSEFMIRYHAVERPKAIFEPAGLHVSLVGYKGMERACARPRPRTSCSGTGLCSWPSMSGAARMAARRRRYRRPMTRQAMRTTSRTRRPRIRVQRRRGRWVLQRW
ncbi:MAG: HTH domain-containing protein [Olsenella profusa]